MDATYEPVAVAALKGTVIKLYIRVSEKMFNLRKLLVKLSYNTEISMLSKRKVFLEIKNVFKKLIFVFASICIHISLLLKIMDTFRIPA